MSQKSVLAQQVHCQPYQYRYCHLEIAVKVVLWMSYELMAAFFTSICFLICRVFIKQSFKSLEAILILTFILKQLCFLLKLVSLTIEMIDWFFVEQLLKKFMQV